MPWLNGFLKTTVSVFVTSILLGLGAVLVGKWPRGEDAAPPEKSQNIEPSLPKGVSRGLYEEGRLGFFSTYRRLPSRADALSFAAELAQSREDYKSAAACFQAIPSQHPKYGRLARYQQGFSLLKVNQAVEAEAQLRKFLALEREASQTSPDHFRDAMQRLRHILEVQLRFHERHELLRDLNERKLAETFDTMAYCFPNLLSWNEPHAVAWCEKFWKNNPSEPLICAALARYRAGQGRLDDSRELLETIPQSQRAHPMVRSAWLYLYSQSGEWSKMDEIVRDLKPPSRDDPWILLEMRGLTHLRMKQFGQAETCYRLLLESDPADAEACQGLGQALLELKRPKEREAVMQKSEILGRIQNRLGWVEENDKKEIIRPLTEIAELCRQIDLEDQARHVDGLIAELNALPQD